MKKNKLTTEQKMSTLISMLKTIRKNSMPPSPEPLNRFDSLPPTADEAYDRAETFLSNMLSGNICKPEDLIQNVEPTAVLYIPALTSLFSLAHQRRSENRLSAWAPADRSLESFPDRHTGIGQIAAASRCFARVLSDILPSSAPKSASPYKIGVHIKRSPMTFQNQIVAPFVWRCVPVNESDNSIDFTGLIRCNFLEKKISSAHITFDAFTIIRQCS
jgi:hypothetical protein